MRLVFLQVYNEIDWIAYAINQAMIMGDQLLIIEGSQYTEFLDVPERSDDGTLDIIETKKREYSGRIELVNSVRKFGNYRRNQCANFNLAVTYCKLGDYFIPLDTDNFFADGWIKGAIELMSEGVDLINTRSYDFVFGFKWIKIIGYQGPRAIVYRKTQNLRFIPTHRHLGVGPIKATSQDKGWFHYMWVKRRERLLLRMRGGRYSNMVQWFNENWDKIELEDGVINQGWSGEFKLRRYEGDHPSVLDSHPWRHIEDIRRITE